VFGKPAHVLTRPHGAVSYRERAKMRTTHVLHNARRVRAAADTLARLLETQAGTDDRMRTALHVVKDLANVVEDLASVVADMAPPQRGRHTPLTYPEDAKGG
jgi:hypothetical protein